MHHVAGAGIIGVGGVFFLLLPVLVSPLAWYYGAVALREIDREPARWGGLGQAKAGLVMGIIGTCLLGLILLLMLLAVMGIVATQAYDSGYSS